MAEAAGRWRHRRQDQTSGIGVKDRQEEDLCGGHRKGISLQATANADGFSLGTRVAESC
jgi:hypothetical protein